MVCVICVRLELSIKRLCGHGQQLLETSLEIWERKQDWSGWQKAAVCGWHLT